MIYKRRWYSSRGALFLVLVGLATGCTSKNGLFASLFSGVSVTNSSTGTPATGGVSGSQLVTFPNPQPKVATAMVNTTYNFSANIPVTWSLAPGSVGSIDAVTGVYSAPISITAHNQIAGCQLLPNDHIYNTRIDALPVDATGTTFLNTNVVLPIGIEASFPENDINNSTPLQNMSFTYTPQNNGLFPSPLFPHLRAEGGYWNVSQSATITPNGADHHTVQINTQTCQASEMYQRYATNASGNNSQSGVQYNQDYQLSGGTDAAGMYLQPLAYRFSELRNCIDNGVPIKHAGRFTLSNGYINGVALWPATAFTNENSVGIKYGDRVRLKASVNISNYAPATQCMLTAMKNYGLFMTDGGDNFGIQTMADVESSADTLNALGGYPVGEIQNIKSTDFEAIDESSLEDLNPSSPTYRSGRVNPSNPYVAPDDSVTVIATDQANPTVVVSIPVILRAVTVSTNDKTKYVMAGTPQIQLTGNVTGTTNTGLTWSMGTPAAGSLTPTGLYTAPASVSSPTYTKITATSVADPSQSSSFYLTIMPGPTIRVLGDNESGPSYNNNNVDYGPDASGNIWWGGRGPASSPTSRGIESSYYRGECSYLGQCLWPTSTDIGIYFSQSGDANDDFYKYSVPNGNYQITLMFASFNAINLGDRIFSVEAQGVLTTSSVDLCTVIGGCTAFTPGTMMINTTVTDNNLYFALRGLPNSAYGPIINGYTIKRQ